MISPNSNFSRKKAYIVPDCQVHEFSYELMGNGIDTTSPPIPVSGEDYNKPGRPEFSKECRYSYDVWEDDNLLDDDKL